MLLEPVNLDQRLPADHRARVVWAVVQKLDLGRFEAPLVNRGRTPGRSAIDPALLVALWLYATIDNVGSARRLARLCGEHDAYRWLCGGVAVNHHTLSDFRVRHEAGLDELFTQVIAALVTQDLVTVERLSQDGMRVRASAGASSFRRRRTLERLRAGEPCTYERKDSPGVAAWRRRMSTPAALLVYQQRAAAAETVNAETRRYRGLGRFLVRGLRKVRCVALWSALAYNVVHFGEVLMRT